jgi:hypothetical protein
MQVITRVALALLFLSGLCAAQSGNACSSNTAAATGSLQSYGYCQPLILDGRNKGGWIALNRTGDQSNSETQCYSPQNVFIQSGILTIIDRSLSKTCLYYPAAVGSGSLTNGFVSGFVQWNTFSFTGGDVLVRAKGPANTANGGWPAIWLLGANCIYSSKVTGDNTTFNGSTCNWHATGSEELDIFEQTPGGGLTSSMCSYFFNTNTQGAASYSITDSSVNWHIYEIRWISGTSVQWYVDGVHQAGCDVSTADVPAGPMFLQMNIAMGPSATSTGLPSSLQLDWVKVCQPSPCDGSGGNIIFYDDFVTPIAASLTRPMAKMARLSGNSIYSGIFTLGIAKNEVPAITHEKTH